MSVMAMLLHTDLSHSCSKLVGALLRGISGHWRHAMPPRGETKSLPCEAQGTQSRSHFEVQMGNERTVRAKGGQNFGSKTSRDSSRASSC